MKLVQLYAIRPSHEIILQLIKYTKYSSVGYIFIHNNLNKKKYLLTDPLQKRTNAKMS